MAQGGGIVSKIGEDIKEVFNFIEGEVEELEGGGEKKGIFTERFKGDILNKSDPYDDSDDHTAHSIESKIPDPDHGSEWFPAVPSRNKKADDASSISDIGETSDAPAGKTAGKIDGDGKDANQQAGSSRGRHSGGALGLDASNTDGSEGKVESLESAGKSRGADNPSYQGQQPSSQGTNQTEWEAARSAQRRQQPKGLETDGGTAANQPQSDVADATENDTTDVQSPSDTVFQQKAPSVLADLQAVSKAAKQAREKKEVLRGVRKTMESPHAVFRDPERLAAIQSGDPEQIRRAMKRHGRQVAPTKDMDAQDLSQNPAALKAVRSDHKLAIRHMAQLGYQYGGDPFDGLSPDDVAVLIDHYGAIQATHDAKSNRHTTRLSRASKNVQDLASSGIQGDVETQMTQESSQDAYHQDDQSGVTQGFRSVSDLQAGGADDDNSDSKDHADSDHDQSADRDGDAQENPKYPLLRDMTDSDGDSDLHPIKLNHRSKQKYPTPFYNSSTPTDAERAAEQMARMAAGAGDEFAVGDDAPRHKRQAQAAKKMLECINNLRSFQQDPAGFEAAFVQESTSKGKKVAGLSPAEVYDRYYGFKKATKAQMELGASTQFDAQAQVAAKHHWEHGIEQEPDSTLTQSALYAASAGISHSHYPQSQLGYFQDRASRYGGRGAELPDIELSLPSNQFQNLDDEDDRTAKAHTQKPPHVGDYGKAAGAKHPRGVITKKQPESMGSMPLKPNSVGNKSKSLKGAIGSLSNLEGKLGEVEKFGSRAETASSKISGLRNAKSDFAKMVNLCSDPIANLTEGENVLAGIKDLAEHPSQTLNQAESMIQMGTQAVAALGSAISPQDALSAFMDFDMQVAGDESIDGDVQGGSNVPGAQDIDYTNAVMPSRNQLDGISQEPVPMELDNEAAYGD